MPDPSVQPPEGLRQDLISVVADRFAVSSFHGPFVDIDATPVNVVDAVLAALFDACNVRERWLVKHLNKRGRSNWTRSFSSRVLAERAEAANREAAETLGDRSVLLRKLELLWTETPPESVGPFLENAEGGG